MTIGSRRHRVVLCSQQDVVVEGGVFHLKRKEVTSLWAEIKENKTTTFTSRGAAMGDSRDGSTHTVYILYSTIVNLSVMAWLYEARMKSSPRWFKIISVGQTETSGLTYFMLKVRLVERADDLATPGEDASPVTPLPPGVTL